MDFEWDENKRRSNLLKHRVDFADAVGVFYDSNAITVEDPDYHNEQRFVTLGMDYRLQTLVVVNTQKDYDTIRIISPNPQIEVPHRLMTVKIAVIHPLGRLLMR